MQPFGLGLHPFSRGPETYGCWGDEAIKCLDRLAARIAIRTARSKSSAVSALYGRLSIVLVRANVRAILAIKLMKYQVVLHSRESDLAACLKLQGQLMYQRDVVACGKKSANHGGT